MAIHLNRDYQQQTMSSTSRCHPAYICAIFARRVLGYSTVGKTNFDIDTVAATTIAVGSNGLAFPQTTINVASTTGFPSSGYFLITTSSGVAYGAYTGTTATSFTGVTQIGIVAGTMSTGGAVRLPLIATGDMTPAGAPTFPVGNRAGINFGAGFLYEVSIPIAVRTVVAGDVGRILVLKSTANPRFNSGCFVITGINAGSNRYIVNWRSGDFPPAESADSMNWYLYENDIAAPPVHGPNNGGTGYRSNGTSLTPRMILQSPHSTGWQVRICCESVGDASTNGTVQVQTFTTGFDGNSAGDFLVGGRHNHAVLWHDSASPRFRCAGMPDTSSGSVIHRFTIIGDDTGQALAFFDRNATAGSSNYFFLGLPDEEPTPLPLDPVHRVFSIGNAAGSAFSGINFSFNPSSTTLMLTAGCAMGFNGVPVTCAPGCWTYASGPGQRGSHFYDASAGDSPWIASTELVTVELVAGSLTTFNTSFSRVLPLEPRVMGVVPMLRQGRTNFGEFTLTTDPGKSWQHMREGVYMPWGGPAVL